MYKITEKAKLKSAIDATFSLGIIKEFRFCLKF